MRKATTALLLTTALLGGTTTAALAQEAAKPAATTADSAEDAFLKAYFSEKELKDYAAAEKAYAAVIAANPDVREVVGRSLLGRARCLRELNRADEAEALFARAETQFADFPDVAKEAHDARQTIAAQAAKRAAAPGARHPLEGLWEVRCERAQWWPHLVIGTMAISRRGDTVAGTARFDTMYGALGPLLPVTVDRLEGERVVFTVHLDPDLFPDAVVRVDARLGPDALGGESRWEGTAPVETCPFAATRAPVFRFEFDRVADSEFPREDDLASVGVDPAALDRLIYYAGRDDTDRLVVVKNGRLVCDRTFGRPVGLCPAEGITKVVASFAVPLLVEDGKLSKDVDDPLSKWYPQWKDDARRSRITLRHVLTHASGLAAGGSDAMQTTGDFLTYALQSPAERDPGTRWVYNNQATELLSGVFARSAGMQVDAYLDRRIFAPLGIKHWEWPRDGAGNIPTFGNLALEARDLARIGRLVASRGRRDGKQIVPEWWFDALVVPSPVWGEQGLAWWLGRDPRREQVVQTQAGLDLLREAGFADADRLAPLVGRTFQGRREWWRAAEAILGENGTNALCERYLAEGRVGGELRGPVDCVYQGDAKGEWLIVYPAADLVVVRQRRGFADDELAKDVVDRKGMWEILPLSRALLVSSQPPAEKK